MRRPTVRTKSKVKTINGGEREGPMIVRAEFRISVMLEAESVAKASALLASTDLNYLIVEMNDGEWLGTHEFTGVQQVFPWEVRDACEAMGGPADFFGNKG